MYFAIDADYGYMIAGWVILDNPSLTPEITIKVPGRDPITFKANVMRPDLLDNGLHSTGLAGFQIDGSLLEGIADIPQLTLFEAESDLPIFRRNTYGAAVEKKLLLMEVATFPQIKLLKHIMGLFDLSYPAIERFPLETTTSILGSYSKSIFVSGRPNWQRHGSALQERGFCVMALLRDPFEELAERLLTLAHMKKWSKNAAGHPLMKHHSVLLGIIDDIDFQDEKSVLRTFRALSPEQHNLLRSPMTSALGCLPEEEVQRRNVSVALDNLSRFDLVGTRDRMSEFSTMADTLIGTPVFGEIPLQALPGLSELTVALGNIGLISDLLDEDIALYSFVSEAIREGIGDQTNTSVRELFSVEGSRGR